MRIVSIGLNLGAKIAVPLVISLLAAIKIDKQFNTTPLFIIFAMIASFTLSTLFIARDIRRITPATPKRSPKPTARKS